LAEKVAHERAHPSLESDIVGLQAKGAKLMGVVVEMEGLQWLEVKGRRCRELVG